MGKVTNTQPISPGTVGRSQKPVKTCTGYLDESIGAFSSLSPSDTAKRRRCSPNRNESAGKDMIVSERKDYCIDVTAVCCQARFKAEKDPTAGVGSENKTHTNPVAVNEETNFLIYDYVLKYAYYALFHTSNGLVPPRSACYNRIIIDNTL